jgi:hypothetical protein
MLVDVRHRAFGLQCLLLPIISAWFAGCSCARDARRSANVCEVHCIAMKPKTLGWGGCVLPNAAEAKAMAKYFPNTFYLPPRPGHAFVCDECLAAESEWVNRQRALRKDVTH